MTDSCHLCSKWLLFDRHQSVSICSLWKWIKAKGLFTYEFVLPPINAQTFWLINSGAAKWDRLQLRFSVNGHQNHTNMQVNNFFSPRELYRDPASICSQELARAAANAQSQITGPESGCLYPPIWSLICSNPPLCHAPNPQQSLIPL